MASCLTNFKTCLTWQYCNEINHLEGKRGRREDIFPFQTNHTFGRTTMNFDHYPGIFYPDVRDQVRDNHLPTSKLQL